MGYIVVFDFMNGIDEARFFLFDQTQCPVDCLPYYPPSPPLAQHSPPGSSLAQHSVDMSISETILIIDDFGDNVTKPVTGELSVGHSPTGSLDAGDDDKKFRVLKRAKSDSIAAFNSLQITTAFVRRNMNYHVKPSQCVMKTPIVGQINAFRFFKGVYLDFLIEEPSSDDGELVLEVMVFKSDDTLCHPNVHEG
ncbi:hypothetical protein ACFE04_020923 [Oxalis oulophora]